MTTEYSGGLIDYMRLSDHFELDELIASQYAARHGIDNMPSDAIIANLETLCADVLEPLRIAVGRPVVVSSGYRSPEVNKAIGGSNGSAHMLGLAADIVVPGLTVATVCREIVRLKLPFDQLIDEYSRWVHVAIAPKNKKPRMQQLVARRFGNGGQTVYSTANFN